MEFKSVILKRLKDRNLNILGSYGIIIKSYEDLLETIVIIKNRHEKFIRDRKDSTQSGGDHVSHQALNILERKCAELQEELTELYKRKGENAQDLIDANRKLESRESELSVCKRKLEESEERISCLSNTNAALKDQIITLEQTNIHLKDEYLVLQTSYNLLEMKFRNSETENQKLCGKYLEMKQREADIMNLENTWQQKLRELNLQCQIAEAAKEQILTHAGQASNGSPGPGHGHPSPSKIHEEKMRENEEQIFRRTSITCVSAVVPKRCKHKIEAHDGEVNAIKWSPSGKYLATGGADRRIKLWNLDDEKPRCAAKLDGCNLAVTCFDFDQDEAYLVCGSNDFAVRTWSLSTQRPLLVFNGHSSKVYAAKFCGSSGRIVSGSHDRTLKVWDMRARCCFKTLFAASICNDLVTSENGPGANVISGHYDKKLRFWDIRQEKPTNEILLAGKVTSLDLSTDRHYLLCCTRDDNLHNIDLRTNRILRSYGDENFKTGLDYTRCAFSPDKQYCAVGSSDGAVFVWNTDTGKLEHCLEKQHETTVAAVCWHPNGQEMASCDKHKTVCIWT